MSEQLGRYRIVSRLGEGGMGVVFRAVALGVDGFEKPVVIKRIAARGRPQQLVNEAKILMGLSHANIVQVLDLGKLEAEYFVVLEYVDGHDLREVLVRCLELEEWPTEELSLHIIAEILRGLQHAHQRRDSDGSPRGIVHRDIKPANVLCSFEGSIKLTDFGIARTHNRERTTRVGAIKGTAGYMSPEQARGQSVDHRSDIFSVGALLYLLLCKARPFPGQNMGQILERVRLARYPSPSSLGVHLPEALENILATAMAMNPDDRFATAQVMLSALLNYQRRATAFATSSDMQALMEGIFETEFSAPSADSDDLVGAELTAVTATAASDFALQVPSGPRANTQFFETVTKSSAPIDVAPEQVPHTKQRLRTKKGHAKSLAIGGVLGLVIVVVGLLVLPTREPPTSQRATARDASAPAKQATATASPMDLSTDSPVANAIPSVVTTTPDATRPKPTPKAAKPTRRYSPKRGWLKVITRPAYADVYKGRTRLGTTPCRIRLTVGRHTLRLVNPQLKLSVRRRVTITAGPEALLKLNNFK